MNREDILRLADKVGMMPFAMAPRYQSQLAKQLGEFAAFAAEWGAKQEREACAKVCEDDVRTWSHPGSITRAECADAIRKRGEVKP